MQEIQSYTETKTEEYPQIVDGKNFEVLKRLMARLDKSTIGDNLFLGYCQHHDKYFLDRGHENEEIRCPICDKEWLNKQKKTFY